MRHLNLSMLVSCIFLNACTNGITSQIAELCEKEGGLRGSKNLEAISSIYYGGAYYVGSHHNYNENISSIKEGCSYWCRYLLMDVGYKFVEVGVTSKEYRKNVVKNLENAYQRQRYFRLSLQKDGSPLCNFYHHRKLGASRLYVLNRWLNEEKVEVKELLSDSDVCIGLEEISSPSSKYGIYEHQDLYKRIGESGIRATGIVLFKISLKNIKTNEVQATANYFGNLDYEWPSGISTLRDPSSWCPNTSMLRQMAVDQVVPPATSQSK